MDQRDDQPGMMRELVIIAIVCALLVTVAVLATSCGLFSSAEESTRQAGQAAEDVGDAVAEMLGTVNQLLLLAGGYLLGELRGPVHRFGKRVVNGRKAAKLLKRGEAVIAETSRR